MNRQLYYDVVVVGGGASGIAAAIAAADTSRNVLLLERNAYLGGQATNSLVPAYCGFCTNGENWSQVVKGVGQEFLDRMHTIGYFDDFCISPTGNRIVPHDPEVTKILMEEMLADHNVNFLFLSQVISAKVSEGRIKELECADDEGKFYIKAKAFVDASGEGNLVFLAKAPYGFHHDQKGSLMFRIGGVESSVDLSPNTMSDAIFKAKNDGVVGLSASKGVAIPIQGTKDYLINLIALDFPGLDAETLTKAEIEGRKQVHLYTDLFKKYIPGMKNSYLVASGPRCGLRESRRIIGDYTLVKDDVKTSKKSDQGIARGGWGAELHVGVGETKWEIERNAKYFDIPLGTLRPKGMKNLWCAGRTISTDLVASSSIRVMGTGFATGQAAGIAASFNCACDDYDVKRIRSELLKQKALI